MKTTLDLPEELVQTLAATAARQQRDISEIAREALTRGLSQPPASAQAETTAEQRRRAMEKWLRGWKELGASIHAKSADPRSMVEILKADRESRS